MECKHAFIYEIRVQEHLSEHWSQWLEGMRLSYSARDETILTGELQDQAGLYGILMKIRNLGLTLVSVRRIEMNGQESIT